jgi:hypothetical protein
MHGRNDNRIQAQNAMPQKFDRTGFFQAEENDKAAEQKKTADAK